jgi:hypothetical protein
VTAATLQNILEPHQIAAYIRAGMAQAVSYTGLRGHVEDMGKGILRKNTLHGFLMFQIETGKNKVVPLLETLDPVLLQGKRVIGIEIVQPYHVVAQLEEITGQMESDETGGSGY